MNCALLRNALIWSGAVLDKSGSPINEHKWNKFCIASFPSKEFCIQQLFLWTSVHIGVYSHWFAVDQKIWKWIKTPDMNLVEAELQVSITSLFVLFLKIFGKFSCVWKYWTNSVVSEKYLVNSVVIKYDSFPGQGKATLLFNVFFTVGQSCQNSWNISISTPQQEI